MLQWKYIYHNQMHDLFLEKIIKTEIFPIKGRNNNRLHRLHVKHRILYNMDVLNM